MELFALQSGSFLSTFLDSPLGRLVLAAALGLFLGLEREWSQKSAGIRTFSLTSLVAAVFTVAVRDAGIGESLLAIGGLLVIVQGILLAVQGLKSGEEDALSLTTSVSLLVAYGVGVLVGAGFVLAGVTVAVVSSLLLVLKRELHGFAGGLTREELRSTTEFAILAFVVYPVLPAERDVLGITFEPRVAWLMVVTVAGIGIVNYALIRSYGGRGIAATGFLGGLASSTAVVGTMLDHVRQRSEAASYAVAAVLLANAAMAVRNLAIALAFTLFADGTEPLWKAIPPLGAIVLGSFAIAWATADWRESVDIDLESPFSLRNVLAFGGVFLLILAGSTVAKAQFGTAGLYAGAIISGLVSSAGVTTATVLLYRGGTVTGQVAVNTILLATAASVVVKAGLAAAGPREFARKVAMWSVALLFVAGAVAGAEAIFA
ncbi:MgtC/SapB family protein [Halegenticoccus soli]|uniref:MgtC/SapB family protein n=1 Tax=Halegenticoccus soli TaxID=1985678 RepID=UPI000C6D55D1|nr:MgtC/SapB family protein [Halegenticoccus soli]